MIVAKLGECFLNFMESCFWAKHENEKIIKMNKKKPLLQEFIFFTAKTLRHKDKIFIFKPLRLSVFAVK
jgi:hypothetical protein